MLARYITILIFCLMTVISGFGQREIDDLRFELNIGGVATHNLSTLGSSIGQCCDNYIFDRDDPLVTTINSIGLDYQYAMNYSVNISLGFMKTGRDVSAFAPPDFAPFSIVFMDDIMIIESLFLSIGHSQTFEIKDKWDINLQNGLAFHIAPSFLDQRYVFSKSFFINYVLKIGPTYHFTENWSLSPRLTSQIALIHQDTRKEYRPLSVGLELSLGYKI